MAWCPKCKNEYVEGIRFCADCGMELVERLEESKEFSEEEYQEVYQEEEAEELTTPDVNDIQQKSAAPAFKGVYQSSTKKAEENRSSAYMLLLIGGIGLLLVLLFLFDVIHIALFATNKYMVCGGMGVLFAVFFIMGIASFRSSRTFEQRAKEENNLTTEIKKWCRENMTAAVIDGKSPADSGSPTEECMETDTEEIKYFKRTERMKELIGRQFMNLDEGFLDAFVDEYYQTIFD